MIEAKVQVSWTNFILKMVNFLTSNFKVISILSLQLFHLRDFCFPKHDTPSSEKKNYECFRPLSTPKSRQKVIVFTEIEDHLVRLQRN